jgi:MarR family multiple antibiotic resistance transcriptional regulator
LPFYDERSYSVERSLGFLVGSLSTLLSADLDALLQEQLGVSIAQWRALSILQVTKVPTAAALCLQLHYDSGAMTRMIDKLESRGLVGREPDETDRRALRLRVTRKGKLACTRGFEVARENLNEALAELTHGEAEQLLSLLTRVKRTVLARRDATTSTTTIKKRVNQR